MDCNQLYVVDIEECDKQPLEERKERKSDQYQWVESKETKTDGDEMRYRLST